MRTVTLAVALTGALTTSACSFMNPSGSAATRWDNIDKARAMKANPELAAAQICRSIKVTGSNLPTRVCSTQAEWDAQEELDRQASEEMNSRMRDGSRTPGVDS